MILSDRTIREEIAAGRIVIDPFDPADVQPSSVDLHVDAFFRVFRNDTTPFIDPKEPQEDLTELVEVDAERAFILRTRGSRMPCDTPSEMMNTTIASQTQVWENDHCPSLSQTRMSPRTRIA